MMIETHRLRCEPLSASHADAMYPLLKNEQIYTYLPEEPPNSVEELRSRYKFLAAGKSPDGAEHWLNWILFLRRTGEPIGFFQATVRPPHCSFAYVLNPAFWRHGYATEASIAIITQLFQRFGLASVRTEINMRNAASIALAKRIGLKFVRHEAEEEDDIYEITHSAWNEVHAK